MHLLRNNESKHNLFQAKIIIFERKLKEMILFRTTRIGASCFHFDFLMPGIKLRIHALSF